MAGSSESAFLFLDTKNGAIAPVVIIHLLLQQPLFSEERNISNARDMAVKGAAMNLKTYQKKPSVIDWLKKSCLMERDILPMNMNTHII